MSTVRNHITAIVLTLNEEKNINQCLSNIIDWADDVFVLDSGSTDQTLSISEKIGAKTFYREFDNYSSQRNYALKQLPIKGNWILFLDADEYLSDELKVEIKKELENPRADGYFMKFRFYFMGRWIKHGGYYGTEVLRLFKKDKAEVLRPINEQITVNGKTLSLNNDIIHDDQKGLHDWLEKHNRYSDMEATELIKYQERVKSREKNNFARLSGTPSQRRAWIRENIWNRFLGPYSKPIFYFFYRYVLRMGFLDGKEGLAFHLLHSFCMVLPTGLKYLEIVNNPQND